MLITVRLETFRNSEEALNIHANELRGIRGIVEAVVTDIRRKGNSSLYVAEGLQKILASVESQENSIEKLRNAIILISDEYRNCEEGLFGKNQSVVSAVLPTAGMPLVGTVAAAGLSPDMISGSDSFAKASAGWFGYEFDEDHPGVTAWVGKASAEAGNDWSYAGVNAYLGKAEADAKLSGGFFQKKTKQEYKDGKWTEKEVETWVSAEASAAASVAIAAVDAKASVGDDMLGAEVKADGAAGVARAKAKAQFSLGEDGFNANLKGEAMVAAVEGKASGTINILGFEIKAEVGGYAGAVGVEAKIGIEDGKFVMKGGLAAVLGISGGIEIGLNDGGWNDLIAFWK